MAAFNLTAEINLRGPSNLNKVVSDIRRQLSTVSLNLNINQSATRNIQGATSQLQNLNNVLRSATANANSLNAALSNLSASIGNAARGMNNLGGGLNNVNNQINTVNRATQQGAAGMENFGRQAALAVRRFAAFSVATGGIYALIRAVSAGYSEFLVFNKELIRLQQVTGGTASSLQGISNEITRLSTSLGVTSNDLLTVSSTLAQAGLSATETKTALEALAKSALAPSFDNLNDTVEGSIALMRQFGISANDLESSLGSVNAVAAAFAVESGDIIKAIQRTGGVFAAASKGVSQGKDALNEFIAVFTSVRATTRESAETIATGLRTIFTRIQRGGTIEALKEYGIVLTDLENKFVGPFEAVRRLSEGLKTLDPRDLRFSKIVEELGGFRQIGKVIPLIQQFATAQQALSVAQRGAGSLAEAAATAQGSLAVKITKVREEFIALIRDIGQSDSFQRFVDISLQLASALISVASAAKNVLPALAALAAIRSIPAIGQFVGGFGRGLTRRNQGGPIRAFATGGFVPGSGNRDTVPAMLTPGEFVIRKKAVQSIGISNLQNMNKYSGGGSVQRFARGGASKGIRKGARSRFRELSEEEIAKLSTADLIKYAKAQAYDIFSSGGAGMVTGMKFVPVPEKKITPELESSLQTYLGKKGFWQEQISPFGRSSKVSAKASSKLSRSDALRKQESRMMDEVAARNQDWTKIRGGSDIDNYLLSSLKDPILTDYKTSRGGGSLAKDFHNTRLRQAVNKALEKYDDFDYSSSNIDKLVSTLAARQFSSGGLIQKFAKGGEVNDPILSNLISRISGIGGPAKAKEIAAQAGISFSDIPSIAFKKSTLSAGKVSKDNITKLVSLVSAVEQFSQSATVAALAESKAPVEKQIQGLSLRGPNPKLGSTSKRIGGKKVGITRKVAPQNLADRFEAIVTARSRSMIAELSDLLDNEMKTAGIKSTFTKTQRNQMLQTAMSTNVGNLIGDIFERALIATGAEIGPVGKGERRPIDLARLGPVAQLFGLDPNQPTEIKRSMKKLSLGKKGLSGQIARFLKLQGFAEGGSPEDTVPALLTPGEFVINKKAAQKIGMSQLKQLNKADKIQGFNKGGAVGGIQNFASGGGVQRFFVGGMVRAFTTLGSTVQQLTTRMSLLGRNIPSGSGWVGGRSLSRVTQGGVRDTRGGIGGMGLMFIGPMIAEAINSSITKSMGKTGAVAGSVITSGISGATIGSVAGPWGALVGGVVGLTSGILNMQSAVDAYTKSQNELKIETESSKLEKALQNLSQNVGNTAENISNASAALISIISTGAENRQISIREEQGLLGMDEGTLGKAVGELFRDVSANFSETYFGVTPQTIDQSALNKKLLSESIPQASALQKTIESQLTSGLSLDQVFKNVKLEGPSADPETKRLLAVARGGDQVTKLEARIAEAETQQYEGGSIFRTGPGRDDFRIETGEEEKTRKLAALGAQRAALIDKLSDEQIKEISIRNQNAKAIKAVNVEIDMFAQQIKKLEAAVSRAGAEFDEASRMREISASAGLEESRIVGPSRLDENVLSNLTAYSTDELVNALDRTSKTLGFSPEFSRRVKTSAVAQQTLESELPKILLEMAQAQKAPGGEADVSLKDRLKEVFEPVKEALGDQISETNLADAIEDITTNLEKSANSLQGKSFEEIVASVAELAGIMKPLSETTKTVEGSLKGYNDMVNATSNEMNAFTNHLGRILDLQIQASTIQLDAANNLKQALGEGVSVMDLNRPFETMIDTLTSTQGPNGLVRGTGTLDPIEIGRRLAQADKELAEQQTAGRKDGESLEDFYTRLAKSKNTVDRLAKAQEALANNTTRASNALNRIRELRQAQENRRNTFDDVLRNINNPEWMMTFTDQVRSLTRIQSGQGTLSDIPLGIEALERRIAGMDPNEQKAERDKFYNNVLEILKKAGIDPSVINNIKGLILGGGPDAKMNEAINQYNAAIKAQVEATLQMAGRMKDSSNAFFVTIVAAADAFLNRIKEGSKLPEPPPQPQPVPVGDVGNVGAVSTGGLIYANKGRLINFQPKGTDTVPAMLTPGEFVVNAKSTKKNIGLLKAINGNTQSAGMSKGGVVYLQDGGQVEKSKKLFGELMASSEGNSGYYSELSPEAIFKDLRATGERPLGYSALSTEDASLVDMAIDNFISTYEKNRTSGIDAEREQIRQDRADSAAALTKIKMDELKEAINAGIVSETSIGATLGPNGYDLSTARSLTVDERAKLRQSKLDKQSAEIDKLALIRQQESQKLLNELNQQKEEARSREQLNAQAKLETNPLTNKPYSSLNEKEAVEARIVHDQKVKAQAQEIERQKLEERRRRFPDASFTEQKKAADIASIEAGTNPGVKKAQDAIEFFNSDPLFKDYRYDPDLVSYIHQKITDKYGDDLSYDRKKSVISGRELPPVPADQLLSIARRSMLDYSKEGRDRAERKQLARQEQNRAMIAAAAANFMNTLGDSKRYESAFNATYFGDKSANLHIKDAEKEGAQLQKDLGEMVAKAENYEGPLGSLAYLGDNIASTVTGTIGMPGGNNSLMPEMKKRMEDYKQKQIASGNKDFSWENHTNPVVRALGTAGRYAGELYGGTVGSTLNTIGGTAMLSASGYASAFGFDEYAKEFEKKGFEAFGAAGSDFVRSMEQTGRLLGGESLLRGQTAGQAMDARNVQEAGDLGMIVKGAQITRDVAGESLVPIPGFGKKGVPNSIAGRLDELDPVFTRRPAPLSQADLDDIEALKNAVNNVAGFPKALIKRGIQAGSSVGSSIGRGGSAIGRGVSSRMTSITESIGNIGRNRSTRKWFEDLQKSNTLKNNPLTDLINRAQIREFVTGNYTKGLSQSKKTGMAQSIPQPPKPTQLTSPQKPFKPQEEVFDVGYDLPDEVNKSFIDGKWVPDDEYAKILAEKTLQEQTKKIVITGTTSPKIIEKTREAVLKAQKKARDIMARYASSPEKAKKIMEKQDELFDIKELAIDPNLKSKTNAVSGKTGGVGAEYRSKTGAIAVPNSETLSSSGLLTHEVFHGVQKNIGTMSGGTDPYKWLRSNSLDNLQPQIDDFLKPGGSYEKLVKDLGGSIEGAGFYRGADIAKRHPELFTNLAQAADTKAFKNNQEAQDMLRAVIKAMGYNKGGMIYASNGTLVPYAPQGTDTVPAMLTPGEFVVNAKATKKNLGLLKAINGGAKGYSKGGVAYLQNGAQITPIPEVPYESQNGLKALDKIQSGMAKLTGFGSGQKPNQTDFESAILDIAEGIANAKKQASLSPNTQDNQIISAIQSEMFELLSADSGEILKKPQDEYQQWISNFQSAYTRAREQLFLNRNTPPLYMLDDMSPVVGDATSQPKDNNAPTLDPETIGSKLIGMLPELIRGTIGSAASSMQAIQDMNTKAEEIVANVSGVQPDYYDDLTYREFIKGLMSMTPPQPPVPPIREKFITDAKYIKQADQELFGEKIKGKGQRITGLDRREKGKIVESDNEATAQNEQKNKEIIFAVKEFDRLRSELLTRSQTESLDADPLKTDVSTHLMAVNDYIKNNLAGRMASFEENGLPSVYSLEDFKNKSLETFIVPKDFDKKRFDEQKKADAAWAAEHNEEDPFKDRKLSGVKEGDLSSLTLGWKAGNALVGDLGGESNKMVGYKSAYSQYKDSLMFYKVQRGKFNYESMQKAKAKNYEDSKKNKQIAYQQEMERRRARTMSTGGVVYASNGQYINYQPRGTDTVPAMLTPGEFVVNRKATRNNLDLLKSINSNNYNTGGIVNPLYLRNGTASSSAGSAQSPNGVSLEVDTGSFDSSVSDFGSSVNTLAGALNQFVSGGATIASALGSFSNVANSFTTLSTVSTLLNTSTGNLTTVIGLFNASVTRMNESLSSIPDTISLNVTGAIPVNVTVTVNGGEGLDEKLSSFEDAIYNEIASEMARATAGRNQIKLNFSTTRK